MSRITVDTTRCIGDGACVEVCPSRSLKLNENGAPEEIAGSDCILCGHCVAVCDCDAITHSALPDEPLLPALRLLPPPAVIDSFLASRRSVREFHEQTVNRDILYALLAVARRAPTATNSQKLHWIVVEGIDKVRALSQEGMNWLRTTGLSPARLKQWEGGYDFILRGAPTVVVACAPADYAWGSPDCVIALTFVELAAECRGLGVCWAGYLTRIAAHHPPLCQALAVPEGYVVHGALMLGEPRFNYRHIPPRKPLSVQWL